MALTVEQIKGRIKNLAAANSSDARVLLRVYMMERFLERLSISPYAPNFVIKGGILVTSMLGVAMRSTMDIDASLRNMTLSSEDARCIVSDVSAIDLDDGIRFIVKNADEIMDEMEYPGIRITMDAALGKMTVPLKIDISTGDAITPEAIAYSYPLLLEKRSIRLWSYNLETILAEKLQTILARGVLNTRMRDYYDIFALLSAFGGRIDLQLLRQAFHATCEKRGTLALEKNKDEILPLLSEDERLKHLWAAYSDPTAMQKPSLLTMSFLP